MRILMREQRPDCCARDERRKDVAPPMRAIRAASLDRLVGAQHHRLRVREAERRAAEKRDNRACPDHLAGAGDRNECANNWTSSLKSSRGESCATYSVPLV
jgi:hypothetical protein